MKITELSSEQIIDHAQMRRRSGVKPSTTAQDITWLGIILKTAVAAWRMPVDLNEFESAKLLLRSKGLISRPASRDRRPTLKEIEQLRAYFQRSQKIRPSAIIPMEDIMDFAIASSRRQEEITRLTWDDLDETAMTCWVRDAKHPRQKWGNHKRFKLTHEAMAIIQRQPRAKGEPRIFPSVLNRLALAFGLRQPPKGLRICTFTTYAMKRRRGCSRRAMRSWRCSSSRSTRAGCVEAVYALEAGKLQLR